MRRQIMVGLGEVLWDLFPDGARFGGAPANFARSAGDLGQGTSDVHIVSAVGGDELGARAVGVLRDGGVVTAHLAQLPYPTGQVDVHIDGHGHASYRFAPDCAWDHLGWTEGLASLAAQCDVVCFGTLGQRSDGSKETIQRFVGATAPSCLRLLDVNLRPPFWTEQTILESLALANAVKLNDDELSTLAGLLGLVGSETQQLRQLISRFDLRLAALTRGPGGALLMTDGGESSDLASPPTEIVDTVGAGDAFAAALVIGRTAGLTLAETNRWAVRVAAYVCSQAGASPRIPVEYLLPHR